MEGSLNLPKMDGTEVRPGVTLVGEPTPVPGTDKLRCLANVAGMLCVVELSIKFKEPAADKTIELGMPLINRHSTLVPVEPPDEESK